MIDFPSDARERELRLIVERAKYERHVMGLVDQLLDREFNRIADILLSPRYRGLTAFQKQRALQLFQEVGRRLGAGYADVTQLVVTEMKSYAQLEATVSRAQVAATLGPTAELTVPLGVSLPASYLAAIAKFPIQGLNIGEWFEAQARTMTLETKRIIQQGLIDGKSPADISRRVLADQRAQGPVLSRRAKQEARSIVRTTVNAVQNDATRASYDQLPDSVSDSWRFLAVRDNRTTLICLSLDGRVFRFDDETAPWPPRHIGCRSTTNAVVKGAEQSMAEQTSQPLTLRSMADWLKAQPITVQNDLLGPTRAGLFRDGTMKLTDALDADNRVLTLAELRAALGLDALATR